MNKTETDVNECKLLLRCIFALFRANKYLYLSEAMQATRNDWSRGFYRVENAIRHWRSYDPLDEVVYEDMQDLLSGEYGDDGRIFRDFAEFSYDELYFGWVDDTEREIYEDLLERLNEAYGGFFTPCQWL